MALLTRNFGRTSAVASVGHKTHWALWVAQVGLALIFLFAGSGKLLMSAEDLTAQMDLGVPIWFLRFIGVCEVAGALGLILPSVSRIRTGLTPLAACGLVVIMVGATTLTAAAVSVPEAAFPLVVGCVAAFVAYGRTHLAPISN